MFSLYPFSIPLIIKLQLYSMAPRSMSSAVVFVLIATLSASSAQDVGCFIPGECYGGSIQGVSTGVAEAATCNDLCQESSLCEVGTTDRS